MTPEQRVGRIDHLLSHVWMVRTFIKHSDEAAEDEELTEVYRDLYDYLLAVGPAFAERDWDGYLKIARKKLRRLRSATDRFLEIQPAVSEHTNFRMAARSLQVAVEEIESLLQAVIPEANE